MPTSRTTLHRYRCFFYPRRMAFPYLRKSRKQYGFSSLPWQRVERGSRGDGWDYVGKLWQSHELLLLFFFFAISFSSNCRKRETQFSSAEYHIRSITLELIPNVFLSLPTSGGESKGGQTTWQQTTVHRRAAANNGWYFHVIWRSYASCVAIGKRIIKRLIA